MSGSAVLDSFRDLTPLDWVLWGLGFGLLAVILVPYLVTVLGLRFIRFRSSESAADVAAVQPDGTNPDYTQRFEELEWHGFRPVGSVFEEMWLYHHDFYKCFPVRMLVSRDGLTHAALYTLGWGGPTRVALDSVTADGRWIQTAMPGAEIVVDEPDYYRTEVRHRPVADLLSRHEREVDRCLRRSGSRLVRVGLAERAALDEKVSRRLLSRTGIGLVLGFPSLFWGVPFGVAYWLLWSGLDQPWPRAMGAAALLAGGAYLTITFKILPVLHRTLERLEQAGPCRRG